MIRKLTALALALAFTLPALAATPVNVNKANAKTIAKSLDGVGMTKAEAIIAYRKAHGPFKDIKALSHVKGIGPTTLAHNHDAIRLSGHPAKATKHAHGK